MDKWLLAKASVQGASHIKSGLPCQDSSIIQTNDSGEWLIAVASDGAGTATRAEEGANFITKQFAEALLKLSKELETKRPGSWVTDYVIEVILKSRSALRHEVGDKNITDFNCTLVACLVGQEGGFAIHIGDGAVFGQQRPTKSSNISHKETNYFISLPENGEYANETYFITESDWIKHLRITPMPSMDWIFLCTDGGTDLSMEADTVPKARFVLPLIDKILNANNDNHRNEILEDILHDPKADKVTGDDKTLAIAIRSNIQVQHILKDFGVKESIKPNVSIPLPLIKNINNQNNNKSKIDVSTLSTKIKKNILKSLVFDNNPVFHIISISFLLIIILSLLYFIFTSITINGEKGDSPTIIQTNKPLLDEKGENPSQGKSESNVERILPLEPEIKEVPISKNPVSEQQGESNNNIEKLPLSDQKQNEGITSLDKKDQGKN